MTEAPPITDSTPPEDAAVTPAKERSHDVASFVTAQVSRLQEGYLANRPAQVSQLARLRQAAGRPIGSDLALLAFTTGGFYRPDARLPHKPTEREQAIHAAITLFAVHQQSRRTKPMHQAGVGVGDAARQLANHEDGRSKESVRRRFEQLGKAKSWDSVQIYARSLIQQLRAHDIPLDYGRFAADLVALLDPARANAVRVRWGREFYRLKPITSDSIPSSESETK